MKTIAEFNRAVISDACEIIEATTALQAIGSMLQRDRQDHSGWQMEQEDRAGLEAAVGPLSSFAQTAAGRIFDRLDDLEELNERRDQKEKSGLEFASCLPRESK
jgi:hypothetical protein